jgi:hypothetical protein
VLAADLSRPYGSGHFAIPVQTSILGSANLDGEGVRARLRHFPGDLGATPLAASTAPNLHCPLITAASAVQSNGVYLPPCTPRVFPSILLGVR